MLGTALPTIVRGIEDSYSIQEYTQAIFIDIEGAFNNFTANSIVERQEGKHNVDAGICSWVNHMLIIRIVTAELKWALFTRPVNRETPKGEHITSAFITRSQEDLGKIRSYTWATLLS